jgi:hypothetical protein
MAAPVSSLIVNSTKPQHSLSFSNFTGILPPVIFLANSTKGNLASL